MKDDSKKWVYFQDDIDWVEGIAVLGRQYKKNGYNIFHHIPKDKFDTDVIPIPIVAKGITAFLSDSSITSFRCSLTSNNLPNSGKGSQLFYRYYYDLCIQTLEINENIITVFEDERKSKKELTQFHLENEKRLLVESQLFYSELKDESERPIIDTIKKAALRYQDWLKNTHLKNEGQNTAIESFKSPKLLKPTKTFPEYLLHDKRELLADKLKTEFNTETGKSIRLMIEALQVNIPQLISIENRQRKAIYTALKLFFDRNVGSRQAVFDYKFDPIVDDIDFSATKQKIGFILESINKTH